MRWQKELTHLIASGWEPMFDEGRFAIRSKHQTFTVMLVPPQGIYDVWFAKLTTNGGPDRLHLSGSSAFDLLTRLRSTMEKDTSP